MQNSLRFGGLKPGRTPRLAVYSQAADSTPAMLYVGVTSDDVDFGNGSPSARVDSILPGAHVSDSRDISPGAMGGAFRCGGTQPLVCARSDDDTMAGLFFYSAPSSVDESAQTFRTDAEH